MPELQKSTLVRLSRPNRKQRWKRDGWLLASDPGLMIVYPNPAGIDAGNDSQFAAVPLFVAAE